MDAGITKASVSLSLNNADKATSPVGYEHFDQITVTRQASPMYLCTALWCHSLYYQSWLDCV